MGEVPPISLHFILFGGDGDPIEKVGRILDGDEDGKYSRIVRLAGIFHFFMEAFKKSNALNEDIISFLVSQYIGKNDKKAAIDKNVSYFLNPNDPVQYERQMGAIVHTALHKALKELKKANVTSSVSPLELHKYLLKCAEDSPQDKGLLNTILF